MALDKKTKQTLSFLPGLTPDPVTVGFANMKNISGKPYESHISQFNEIIQRGRDRMKGGNPLAGLDPEEKNQLKTLLSDMDRISSDPASGVQGDKDFISQLKFHKNKIMKLQ